MAGRERSGPSAAVPDLFLGRPWVITDSGASRDDALLAVRHLAVDVGAVPVTMDADEHDAAVAVVSHVPQLASSLVAARLRAVDEDALALAGQGLRDVTRLAASDPALWTSILAANAAAVRDVLVALREDLDVVVGALDLAAAATAAAVTSGGAATTTRAGGAVDASTGEPAPTSRASASAVRDGSSSCTSTPCCRSARPSDAPSRPVPTTRTGPAVAIVTCPPPS